jgi:hypothetical protein
MKAPSSSGPRPNTRTPAGASSSGGEAEACILFGPVSPHSRTVPEGSVFLEDLHLRQIIDAVLAGREQYRLREFFLAPLGDEDAIAYRHEVLKDLARPGLRKPVQDFAAAMHSVRSALEQAGKLHYPRQRQAWVLDAALLYADAVAGLAEPMASGPASRALKRFGARLSEYAGSETFTRLRDQGRSAREGLERIRYLLRIKGPTVSVRALGGEEDYNAKVRDTFARFEQPEGAKALEELRSHAEMDHVEAKILDLVAALHPERFGALEAFAEAHQGFVDPLVAGFDREIQFYLAWLEHTEALARDGLPFCFPKVGRASKEVHVREAFDLALAQASHAADPPRKVVLNPIDLDEGERIIVVAGPNQGGKTTYARAFGQLHYFAALGLTVPAREAALFLPDAVYTHFERGESHTDTVGKLHEELIDVQRTLSAATGDSMLILNEIFTSTSLEDAVYLGSKVIEQIDGLGALCVCVTFVEELADASGAAVSVSTRADPKDPTARTFEFVRRRPDGLAYAVALARKHRLDYDSLTERLGR